METLSELNIPVRYGQPKIRVYLNRHGEEKSFLYSYCDYQAAPADGGAPWLSIRLLTLMHYLEYGDGDFEKQMVLHIDDNDAG